jgi:hypothetical protein
MATVVQGRREDERRYHERRRGWNAAVISAYGMRVSWGSIWSGVLVAVGTLILLTSLGLAVGISGAEAAQNQAETLGTAAGIWAGISFLIALFLGGWVATRIGAITDATTGFFEGSLVWVLSLLITAWAASSGVSALTGGAFRIVGGATQTVGQAVQSQPLPPAASQAAWITFGVLVVSLLAAAIGAMAGRRRSIPPSASTPE